MKKIHSVFLAATLLAAPALAQEPRGEAEELARQIFTNDPKQQQTAVQRMIDRGKTDVVPALIQTLRYVELPGDVVGDALRKLTGASVPSEWHAWMLWQQAHPEIKPFKGFDTYKADVMAAIDPNYRVFLKPGVKHEIRLEEIAWGGVPALHGIPSLDYPKFIEPAEATYITKDELVFGVAINGDVRAYPLRFMDWHEMFNDKIGGKHVALAYCTLCASGILFETDRPPRPKPFVFGSSGFLYRSNKLMYDHETKSLWNQFTGRPVVGPLTGSDIELKVLPVAITSWEKWLVRHPETKVLSPDTGHSRDYTPGQPYASYFASSKLMFPALSPDERQKPKDYVYTVRTFGAEKAWSLALFEGGAVLNETLGDKGVVLIGDAATRTVRAYNAGELKFEANPKDSSTLVAADTAWRITENALTGPDGRKLARLPGHIAYWFAWSGYKPQAAFRGK